MERNISGENQKKQVVLMVAKEFLAYHFNAGKPTFFQDAIGKKVKVHTIRGNYEKWKKKIDEVNSGKAELILKEWSGKPYRSKQNKLFTFDQNDGIDVSKLTYVDGFFNVNDELIVPPEILAKNDGLTLPEFEDWFKVIPAEPMALIHLTPFRYKAPKMDLI